MLERTLAPLKINITAKKRKNWSFSKPRLSRLIAPCHGPWCVAATRIQVSRWRAKFWEASKTRCFRPNQQHGMTWPPWCKQTGGLLSDLDLGCPGAGTVEPETIGYMAFENGASSSIEVPSDLAMERMDRAPCRKCRMPRKRSFSCRKCQANPSQFRRDRGIPRKDSLYNSHSSGLESSWIEETTLILFRHVEAILGVRFCLGGRMPGAMCSQIYCRCKQACTQSREMPAYENDLGLWFAALSL